MLDELLFDKYSFQEPTKKDEAFSLLIYDIVDNSKRIKFAKFMESYGIRVQKSAIEIRVDKKKFQEMLDKIPYYITAEDSVKIYKIKGNGDVYCWGNAKFEVKEDVIII